MLLKMVIMMMNCLLLRGWHTGSSWLQRDHT